MAYVSRIIHCHVFDNYIAGRVTEDRARRLSVNCNTVTYAVQIFLSYRFAICTSPETF